MRWIFEPLDRIAQRPGGPFVLGAVFRRIVRGRVRAGAVGHPFDEGRAEIGARPLGRPQRGRMDRKIIVAVDAQRRDGEAVRAGGEFGALAAGDPLIGRDRPLVVDDVENDRRPVDGGEHQRRMEVALRRRAFADPARGDAGIAGDRRGHRPADRVRILGAEIAGDGEESGLLGRIEPGQLPALETILFVGEDLAHHVDDRPAVGDQEALLAIGRKAHVARLERLAMGGRDRLLAEEIGCRTTSCPGAGTGACGRRRRGSASCRAGPCADRRASAPPPTGRPRRPCRRARGSSYRRSRGFRTG